MLLALLPAHDSRVDSSERESAAGSSPLPVAVNGPGDYETLLDQLRRAARAGDVPSQELLGVLLLGGPAALDFGGASGQQTCEALAWLDRADAGGSRLGRGYATLLGAGKRRYARANCLPDPESPQPQDSSAPGRS